MGFSSVSALIGLSRGTSYSASNAYLDGLGLWRHKASLPFSSVQWGPVAEVGMASKDGPKAQSLQTTWDTWGSLSSVLMPMSVPTGPFWASRLGIAAAAARPRPGGLPAGRGGKRQPRMAFAVPVFCTGASCCSILISCGGDPSMS